MFSSSTTPPPASVPEEQHWTTLGPHWFGYLGFTSAIVYRIPQITKLVRTKQARDISGPTFMCHNVAYVSFILYLLFDETRDVDPILLCYYFMGICQNLLIFILTNRYVRLERERQEREAAHDQPRAVAPPAGNLVVVFKNIGVFQLIF